MKEKEPVKSSKPHPFDAFWEFQKKKAERHEKGKDQQYSKPYWW
ncbi:hypothetical protein JMA_18550 [Jeotgalibacillus malaysiensis]|uniref:Uncharacterized protein n=1 Tax=Jeotgalibacillus malaysiensis TaxID=1508404 RepID=A0A0B5AR93_9BACL|nr:hypothetical protein [Jeotgalibacillus malaysiensis]AJD91172.1 hypothetical protein JMA_18550 [Jeotgalibacillus malaysiensis]